MIVKRAYRYFGEGEIETGEQMIRGFGTSYQLDDVTALAIMEGGSGILPADLFTSIGYTEEEIKLRAKRRGEEFMAKHRVALAAALEFKDRLKQEIAEKENANV